LLFGYNTYIYIPCVNTYETRRDVVDIGEEYHWHNKIDETSKESKTPIQDYVHSSNDN